MELTRMVGIVATGSLVAGCMGVDTNHAPVVHPVAVTVDEDWFEELTIHAEDIDGDDLELTMWSAAGGEYDLEKVTQRLVDGVNHLEAVVELRAWPDLHGMFEFEVGVSDGVERASATISLTIVPVNDEPTARDDAFATATETELVLSPSTVLANDDDAADVARDEAPNLGLTVASVGPVTHGVVTLVGGAIRFVPEPGFAGTAPFTYRITDGAATAEATVRVMVGGPNAAPIASDDMERTMEGVPVEIDVGRLLANDLDDDGHTLAVVAVSNPDHGTVELRDRTITYAPTAPPGETFFGTARFDYVVTDGAATATGHVVVEVAPWI